MKNTIGQSITFTLFGESHGEAIGGVLDGLTPGIEVDMDFVKKCLDKRKGINALSTPRREEDEVEFLSGVFNGKTTGTPLAFIIRNKDTKSADYGEMKNVARPSHADFTAEMKYMGFQDYRGGGHFSGRLTAPIVVAGAIIMSALNKKGIEIGTHIKSLGTVTEKSFNGANADEIKTIFEKDFPVLDEDMGHKMQEEILKAKEDADSIGGVLETMVTGLPAGVGEPWFDSLESVMSHALFSIPGVKGVEFGGGFEMCNKRGSEVNDSLRTDGEKVYSETNYSGGINGGISNGMPIIVRTGIKPTPTIGKTQDTINFKTMENTEIKGKGRHDPAIIHRAAIVVSCMTAITVADSLALRFGTNYLTDK